MNHIRAAIPTLMPRSFMFAPHLNGGAAGAAAEELAETLITFDRPLGWLIDCGAKTLFDKFEPIRDEEMERTDDPIARTGASTALERTDAILADVDFIVNAMNFKTLREFNKELWRSVRSSVVFWKVEIRASYSLVTESTYRYSSCSYRYIPALS